MKREATLLNLICIVAAIAFLALAAINALTSFSFFTTDNLFVTMVCLLMALLFAVNPLFYLHEQGRLPIPFAKRLGLKRSSTSAAAVSGVPQSPPLLDARGRAVPPDVRSMVANMQPKEPQ